MGDWKSYGKDFYIKKNLKKASDFFGNKRKRIKDFIFLSIEETNKEEKNTINFDGEIGNDKENETIEIESDKEFNI